MQQHEQLCIGLSPICEVMRAHRKGHARSPERSCTLTCEVMRAHQQGHAHSPARSCALTSKIMRAHLQGHARSPARSCALNGKVMRIHLQGHARAGRPAGAAGRLSAPRQRARQRSQRAATTGQRPGPAAAGGRWLPPTHAHACACRGWRMWRV